MSEQLDRIEKKIDLLLHIVSVQCDWMAEIPKPIRDRIVRLWPDLLVRLAEEE